eukprot:COSAG04_NODE_19221_length_421_cov_1.068323_2_plen_22_part_01
MGVSELPEAQHPHNLALRQVVG